MENQRERRIEGKTREAVKVLECFEGLSRLYWLDVLIKQGGLSKAKGGQLIINGRV